MNKKRIATNTKILSMGEHPVFKIEELFRAICGQINDANSLISLALTCKLAYQRLCLMMMVLTNKPIPYDVFNSRMTSFSYDLSIIDLPSLLPDGYRLLLIEVNTENTIEFGNFLHILPKNLNVIVTPTDTQNLIALIPQLTKNDSIDLRGVDLLGLTVAKVTALNLPDGFSIQGLDLSDTNIKPDVALALIAKLKPTGDINLNGVALYGLIVAKVTTLDLPADFSIQDLDLSHTTIHPDVALALIAKLKPTGDINLIGVELYGLTVAQVNSLDLPADFSIRDLDLSFTKIRPDVALVLLAKLNPKGNINLARDDLSGLTVEQVTALNLPDGFSIQGLDLSFTRIRPDVALALIAKLNPTGDICLWGVHLSQLTVVQVNSLDLPDGFSIQDLDLSHTTMRPDVALALIAKLKPTGDINLIGVKLSELRLEHVDKFLNSLPEDFSIQNLNLDLSNKLTHTVLRLISKLKPISINNIESTSTITFLNDSLYKEKMRLFLRTL